MATLDELVTRLKAIGFGLDGTPASNTIDRTKLTQGLRDEIDLKIKRRTYSYAIAAAESFNTYWSSAALPTLDVGKLVDVSIISRNQESGARYITKFSILISRGGGSAIAAVYDLVNLNSGTEFGTGTGYAGLGITVATNTAGDNFTLTVKNNLAVARNLYILVDQES